MNPSKVGLGHQCFFCQSLQMVPTRGLGWRRRGRGDEAGSEVSSVTDHPRLLDSTGSRVWGLRLLKPELLQQPRVSRSPGWSLSPLGGISLNQPHSGLGRF